jgi:magnesium chelatase subunit D
MTNSLSDLSNPFTWTLACAALSEGLRSILVFDSAPSSLRSVALTFAQMLEVVYGRQVILVNLSASRIDDDLWGVPWLGTENGQVQVLYRSGLLASDQNESSLQLILIPDLTRLSLPAARACVALLGADTAHLERHGIHQVWHPNMFWLAGCDSRQVGKVSPHLLDRFTLRLQGQADEQNADRTVKLMELVTGQTSFGDVPVAPLPVDIRERLVRATHVLPEMTTESIQRVLAYLSVSEVYSQRREIAFARLAIAIAQFIGTAQVTTEHVDVAAALFGLKSMTNDGSLSSTELTPSTSSESKPSITRQRKRLNDSMAPEQSIPHIIDIPVYDADRVDRVTPAILSINPAAITANPYPEDTAVVEHEAFSLRMPMFGIGEPNDAQGLIIGVEHSTNLHDLAIVSTLLQAAKYQKPRRTRLSVSDSHLILSPVDLRRYRRAPVALQTFVLLLDYTCLRGWNWWEALKPYLHWAYVVRASVYVIQVGAAIARSELQAERIMTRSIMNQQISAALEMGAGRATPLAHGLDIALSTLRHTLQHGRSASPRALFVIVSDGRGNVSLKASRENRLTGFIGREGVDDALEVARSFRDLKHLDIILLNPQPKLYAELPFTLAEALGATVLEHESAKAAPVE